MGHHKPATVCGGRSSRKIIPPFAAVRRIARTSASAPHGDALQLRKYRALTRQHLDRLQDNLFADFTGLNFHISWAPAPAREWKARTLPTGCSVCCRLSGSPLLKDCRICGAKQLARTFSTNGDGLYFTCRLGVRNYWLPIRVRGETLGIAYLQALDHSQSRRPARKYSARVVRHRLPPADARVMDRPEFTRAARFLQFIVQHLQTASLSDLRKAELTSAGRAVVALEKEQAQLHEALQRHLPPPPQVACRSGTETHAEQAVQGLLECISRNYGQPITLQRCATKLGMNAAYLSALFSRAIGKPFKTYLTERRVEKAKALLSDPAQTASEVAYAVGYASENRFRLAFKKASGLSPKLWRETMQTNPPLPSTS